MTEFWKSQENWFCKYCKCWVNDNPISRQIHENGQRHKRSVEEKLSEIRKKQVTDAKQTKDEAHWLKKMEEAALKDYKKKDIKDNRDFTAKLYNNEDLPDVDEKYESIRQANQVGPRLPGEPEAKHMKFENMLKAGEEGNKEINPVKATTSGTKWHKPPAPKYWYEAKNEDGHSYYWNINTKESRWDPPPAGYVTIKEQEELQQKKEEKKIKKAQMIEMQREKFSKPATSSLEPEPEAKTDAYGGRGWQKVEEPEPEPKIDFGLPTQRPDKFAPVIQAVPDKTFTFKEKTIGSLGGSSSGGAGEGGSSKPAIVFRKRKNQSIRQRGDD
eukprot:TRINITY_DN1316_c0_g1_i1.p1 TRINITY_DN1316_c0_g1~~TRINITY_DN1316_c0_g1_i1.p1  ORF type:complete len:328 (-),score=83.42 TRINITY_DN1316_c0_g1_i1:157-1140(-)